MNPTVDLIPGFAEVAALDACEKAIKALIARTKPAVADRITDWLIARGVKLGQKPETMHPVDKGAAGAAYLRRHDSRKTMQDDALDLLSEIVGKPRDTDGCVPGYTDVLEASPTMLAVNAAYANDEVLLRKIDKAIAGIKGIPADFIVQIAPATRIVVSDKALDNAFKNHTPEDIEKILPLIGSTVLKPVFSDVEKAWELVKPMIEEYKKEINGEEAA